jgi:hypothetical protein
MFLACDYFYVVQAPVAHHVNPGHAQTVTAAATLIPNW